MKKEGCCFPLIGKHIHVQRHILSYLRPNELRIARAVFRDCPLPNRRFLCERTRARDLMCSKEYRLFAYEVEHCGMNPGYALDEAFQTTAPANVIAYCARHAHASPEHHGIEYDLCRYERLDVLKLLAADPNFIMNYAELCYAAWVFDYVGAVRFVHSSMRSDRSFIKMLWPIAHNVMDNPFDGQMIPVRVLECLIRSHVFYDLDKRAEILDYVVHRVRLNQCPKHVPAFDNRVVAICNALVNRFKVPDREDVEEYGVEETPLWNRVCKVVWPN